MFRGRGVLPLTGCVSGGGGSLGRRKPLPAAIDGTCQLHERSAFSGGRIGCQIGMAPDGLARAVPLVVADLTVV